MMKMRVNIFSCLSAFVLSCNVTAAIIHEIVEEKTSVTLPCPPSVEGKVTKWSRESNGGKVDIFTIDGDREIRHINDPFKRYSSQSDKLLHIRRVTVSDTGRYFCNDEAAVELTVIRSAIIHETVEEKTSVTLPCLHSVEGKVTWSRESNGSKVDILTTDGDLETRHIHDSFKRYSSLGYKSLHIQKAEVSDTGRYFCGDEAAVELTVIPSAAPYLWQTSVRLVIGILYLIVMISITVTTWTKARQKKKRHTQKQEMISDPPSHTNQRGGAGLTSLPPAFTAVVCV